MKKLKWIALIAVVLVVGGLGVCWVCLDSIVRAAVQTQATSALKLETTVGALHLSILHPSLSIRDLTIASPTGYQAPHMLTLGGSDVSVSISALRQEPIHISNIDLQSPVLTLEQSGLKMNIQALTEQSAPSSGTGTTSTTGQSGASTKLIIDDLKISGAQVIVRPGLPGISGPAITVPLGALEMKNIGNADGNQNGVAMRDVILSVMAAMVTSAGNSDLLPSELKDLMKLNVGKMAQDLGGDLQKQIGNVGNLGKNLTQGVGNITKNSAQNLGNAMHSIIPGKKSNGTSSGGN
jgi:hypothetical protein